MICFVFRGLVTNLHKQIKEKQGKSNSLILEKTGNFSARETPPVPPGTKLAQNVEVFEQSMMRFIVG